MTKDEVNELSYKICKEINGLLVNARTGTDLQDQFRFRMLILASVVAGSIYSAIDTDDLEERKEMVDEFGEIAKRMLQEFEERTMAS